MITLGKLSITTVSATAIALISSYSAQAVVFFPETGHYYDFVSTDLGWEESKIAAESLSYNGLQGYLATITSQAEQDFIFTNIGAPSVDGGHSGWIGANDTETEGTLKWVTGPEAGTIFWQDSVEIGYNNFLFNEPDNYLHTSAGEDHVIMLATGYWVDTTNPPPFGGSAGYFVEYGGMEEPIPELPEPSGVLTLLAIGTFGSSFLKRKK